MGNVIQFPSGTPSRFGFQRVQATYTVREISRLFGVSESYLRRWTREGLIQTAASADPGEMRYDIRSLRVFRRVRELRSQGLSLRQIDAELRGQLNLFPEPMGQLIQLPVRLTPFEEALLLHERKEYQKATECYLKAIQADDSIADAYCNLGILEFEGGNVSGAFDRFTASLSFEPRHFESHFNLANLYFEAGDLRLAQLHYELAGRIEPGFPNLHFNLGLVHAMNGNLEAAIEAMIRAKEVSPEIDLKQVDDLLASLRKALAHKDS